jgi:hypothetical protein
MNVIRNIQMRYDIKGISFCYIWHVRDISMSLALGTSGRGEVATPSSLCIHVSRLYKRAKWPVWPKIIPSLRSSRWSDFCKQKEWVRARLAASYWVFTARTFSAERNCLCFRTNLMMAEQHSMMIRRNRGKLRASHTDDNCVNVEDLIKGKSTSQSSWNAMQKKKQLCITSHP